MSYRKTFSDDQWELLVALPYRTGLWVSESDQTGGEEAGQAEMKALEAIITGYAQDCLKSEFVEEVMRETIANRDKWEMWGKDLSSVPDQCKNAQEIVDERVPVKDAVSFGQNLMEIAVAVAMAYREYENTDTLGTKLHIRTRYYLAKLASVITRQPAPELEAVMNISAAEQKALNKLSKSLRFDNKVAAA